MANNEESLYSPIKRYFVRRAYQQIYTTVNNQKISDIFSSFLNISKSHFIPIPDSLSNFGWDISRITDKEDHGYIFMGGATHRDYSLFIEVAKRLPKYHFVAVTFESYKDIFKNAPLNVKVKYGMKENEFYQVIANSSLVFVPILNNMQGGQLVLFQGALLEKSLVTTENIAIHTYFNEKSVKLIPIGDTNMAVKIIIELMGNCKVRQERGKAAYNDIIKFTPEKIYEQYKQKLFFNR
nr:hypothetical protein [uncultured Flavobacterium sp.]